MQPIHKFSIESICMYLLRSKSNSIENQYSAGVKRAQKNEKNKRNERERNKTKDKKYIHIYIYVDNAQSMRM